MHAHRLTTRIKLDAFQGEACLLAYDEQQLTGTMLGDDIREVFDTRPGTARIYILAPFLSEAELRECLRSGAALPRVGSYFDAIGGRLCLLSISSRNGAVSNTEIPFFVDEFGKAQEEPQKTVDKELRDGWLFDLFDKYRGRVDAPVGVHFAKSSRRHSPKFLRTSNVLLSSSACAVIAYFALGVLDCTQPRRIFVDTAPLLGVAFSLQRIALLHNVWSLQAPVTSFSSYGGLDRLPASSRRDLILISASTSGGLVQELIAKEFDAKFIATLYYLNARSSPKDAGAIVCDLTFRQGRMFGYPPIESFPANDCPLCKDGHFVAELEGDQFQLEKRAVKHLFVKTVSQTKDSRETLEGLARKKILTVQRFNQRDQCNVFSIDADLMLGSVNQIRSRFLRSLRRHVPLPLNCVILVDISPSTMQSLIAEAGMTANFRDVPVLSYEMLPACEKIPQGGALVVFGTLSSFAKARDINAQLRSKVPQGCVAYLAGITIANSAEHLADLKMFLTYGEFGRETFTFDSACNLMLPSKAGGLTSWEAELALLQQLREDGDDSAEIQARLNALLTSGAASSELFWPGQSGELEIKNDFVYLTVSDDKGKISQADILATISNLLATSRMNNRGLSAPIQAGKEPIHWHQSVYGHVLLSPSSFEDYNDAVLHAAMLRGATPAELNYANDERSSGRVMAVIQAGIQGWDAGAGDSTPEFLLALAIRRLVLTSEHEEKISLLVRDSALPHYLKAISAAEKSGGW